MNQKSQTNNIDEIFLAAYARQGMSYKPLENDCYEYGTEQRYH